MISSRGTFGFLALLASASSASAAITISAVGVYDDATNANAVDAYGTGDLASYNTYRSEFQAAFTAGTGGVINFDGTTGNGNLTVNYGATALLITRTNDGNGISMNATSTIKSTPLSGANYYRLGANGAGNGFSFSTPLSSFGLTVLARNDARTVTIRGLYTDGTTFNIVSNYSLAANAVTNTADYINSPTSGPDTFFGFTAEAGKQIASFNVLGENLVIDDLGFVTAIPEPSVALLGAAALAGFAVRRRRTA